MVIALHLMEKKYVWGTGLDIDNDKIARYEIGFGRYNIDNLSFKQQDLSQLEL